MSWSFHQASGLADVFGCLRTALTCRSRSVSEPHEGVGFQITIAQRASELACQPGALADTGQGHRRCEVVGDGVQQVGERGRVALFDVVSEVFEQMAGVFDRGGAVGMHVEAEDRVVAQDPDP